MRVQNLGGYILAACLLAVSALGTVSVADAKPAKKHFAQHSKKQRPLVVDIYRRDRAPLMYVPVGPSYLAYDYAYYYRRGYYPRHIGPHYIYYGPQD